MIRTTATRLMEQTPHWARRPGKVIRGKLPLVSGLAVYAVALHWTYQTRISPAFSYLGLRYREPNYLYYFLAFGLVCGTAFLMPAKLRRPSDFILWVLFVMAAVPSILVPQYGDIITEGRSLELAIYVALSFGLVVFLAPRAPQRLIKRITLGLVVLLPPRFRQRFIKRIIVPPPLFWWVVILVSVGTYGYFLFTTGLSFKFVSIGAVRDIRFQYRDQIAVTGPALGYLVRLQGNVLNPLIIAFGVYSRRWSLVMTGAVGQLLIFAITGFKLTLLSPIALIAVAVLFRIRREPSGQMILAGTMASMAAALIVDAIRGGLLFTEVFVNRLLLTPGVLTAAHVMVFQGKPKAEWGYSFMAPFVDSPYKETPAFMVGRIFTGDTATSANANFFADGFANLGYAGMFVEALALVVILWLIDSAGRHIPLPVTALILLLPTLALVNSGVFTSLLTNGYLAAMVVLACLPPGGWGTPPHSWTRATRLIASPRSVWRNAARRPGM